MYSAPFEYQRASSWEDAVAQLERGDEDAHVLAGGQSLVPMMMLGLAAPTLLVDVGGAGERTIQVRDRALVLSALVRHVDLERSDVVRDACPMLTEAVKHIGNVRVRHRGTIGGSLAHAEATAELAAVAVAHRATTRVLGPRGERTVPAADLFVTHLTTSLEPADVITGVEFPASGPRTGSCFLEMARRAGDFAIAEVAAIVSLDEAGRSKRSGWWSARCPIGPLTCPMPARACSASRSGKRPWPSWPAPWPARSRSGRARTPAWTTGARWSGCWLSGRSGPRPSGRPGGPGRIDERANGVSKHEISLLLNGHPANAVVEPNMSLLELLRTEAGRPRSSSAVARACAEPARCCSTASRSTVPGVRRPGPRPRGDHGVGPGRRG